MNNFELATFAGGCFWCTEAIFKRLKGVVSVIPGFTGGTIDNPSYEQVCEGNTGHTEAIQIKFDPDQIPFDKLLDIFWHTHNPTTVNQQDNDVGPEYRSAIFYHNEEQKEAAQKSKAKLEKENVYTDPIVTQISPLTKFYPAENYHQNYFEKNQGSVYCNVVINPKIEKLLELYRKEVKDEYK